MKSLIKNISKLITVMALISFSNILNAHINDNISIEEKLKKLENTTEGRIGIFAVNTENGQIIEYRANETFPTGCTSKVIGVSAVLKKSMDDSSLLATSIKYAKEDLAPWSPITEKNISQGLTIQELCAASISYSDNTAMNLLLKQIGGVQGMNQFARTIEDPTFRQDHDWPLEAYSGGPNNLNDTSTPKAMVESLRKLTLGNVLDKPQKDLLITWLKDTTTGAARIRSGVPQGWVVGNKTGTGGIYGSTNDLAIIWPTKHEPLLLGVYYTSDNKKAMKREDIVSTATKLVVEEFINNDKKLLN
ncbi:MAG: class A beta-lactamase [Proteobacteria bacterium]|nr:class A beta-lactamase [Pseudomonadota bacterium]